MIRILQESKATRIDMADNYHRENILAAIKAIYKTECDQTAARGDSGLIMGRKNAQIYLNLRHSYPCP